MRKYEEYKDSGNFLLKEIPNKWSKFRFTDKIELKHGFQFREDDFTDEGLKIVKITQLSPKGYLDLSNCSFIDTKRLNIFRSIVIKNGDVLMALTGGTIGKIIRAENISEPLLQNYRVGNFFPSTKDLDKIYMFYLLSSQNTMDQINYLINRNGQPNIGKENFKNMTFPLPSFSEQQAIANYLDAKTQAIDKKVALLEQKIETYKKLKNTIIAKAVTQGISNQDLSINDLGFKTPANWTKYRLKDLGKLYSGLSGKSGDDFNQEDNPNNRGFIPFTNIANNTYLKKDHLGTVVINPGEKQNKVRKGDLFFLMSSEGYGDIGKTAVLADDIDEAYLNSFCKGYRVNQNKCNPYFLNYLLLSNIYRQRLIVEGKGFTRINLKMEKVTDFEIFLPPTLSEQKEIANYIDHKTVTIDAIVGNISKQIDTLKQLRKTLINDVVTGKIKVIE